MSSITIDKEFKELCPPLTSEERGILEASIAAEGCRDPLDVWNGVIVDGHNRFEICTAKGISFKTRKVEFASRGDAINWIIGKQLGRRNLTDETKSYLRGKRYHAEKQSTGNPTGRNGGESDKKCQIPPRTGDTRERLAKEYGVGKTTIQNDAQFATAVDLIAEKHGNEAKQLILSGQSGLRRLEILAGKTDGLVGATGDDGKPRSLRSELRKAVAQQKRDIEASARASGAISQQSSDEIATPKQKRLRELHEAIKRLALIAHTILDDEKKWIAAIDSEHWTAATKTTIRNKLSGVETDLKRVHKILK